MSDRIEPLFNSRLFPVQPEGTESDEVYTPPWIFDQLALTFDLDVAAPTGGVEWIPAAHHYDLTADGLSQPWTGRVWMNPPYSNATPWVERFVRHRHGVAMLPFARSRHLNVMWDTADALVIPANVGSFEWAHGMKMRLPMYLAAFGADCVEAVARLGIVRGMVVANA